MLRFLIHPVLHARTNDLLDDVIICLYCIGLHRVLVVLIPAILVAIAIKQRTTNFVAIDKAASHYFRG